MVYRTPYIVIWSLALIALLPSFFMAYAKAREDMKTLKVGEVSGKGMFLTLSWTVALMLLGVVFMSMLPFTVTK